MNRKIVIFIVVLTILAGFLAYQLKPTIDSYQYYKSEEFQKTSFWLGYFIDVYFMNYYSYPENSQELLSFLEDGTKFSNQTGFDLSKILLESELYFIIDKQGNYFKLISKRVDSKKNQDVNLSTIDRISLLDFLLNRYDIIVASNTLLNPCNIKPKQLELLFNSIINQDTKNNIFNQYLVILNDFRFAAYSGNLTDSEEWSDSIYYFKANIINDSLIFSVVCEPSEIGEDFSELFQELYKTFSIASDRNSLKCFFFPLRKAPL